MCCGKNETNFSKKMSISAFRCFSGDSSCVPAEYKTRDVLKNIHTFDLMRLGVLRLFVARKENTNAYTLSRPFFTCFSKGSKCNEELNKK